MRKWVFAIVLAVVGVCALDLKCSMTKDRDRPTTMHRIREELDSGRREQAQVWREGMERQLRGIRVQIKKLLREGKDAEARRLMGAASQLERRLYGKPKEVDERTEK